MEPPPGLLQVACPVTTSPCIKWSVSLTSDEPAAVIGLRSDSPWSAAEMTFLNPESSGQEPDL